MKRIFRSALVGFLLASAALTFPACMFAAIGPRYKASSANDPRLFNTYELARAIRDLEARVERLERRGR